jgi:hypothetical protein
LGQKKSGRLLFGIVLGLLGFEEDMRTKIGPSSDRSLKVVKLFVIVEEGEVLRWEVTRKRSSEVKRREIAEATFGLLYASTKQRTGYDVREYTERHLIYEYFLGSLGL